MEDRFVKEFVDGFMEKASEKINSFLKENPQYRIGAIAPITNLGTGFLVYFEKR